MTRITSAIGKVAAINDMLKPRPTMGNTVNTGQNAQNKEISSDNRIQEKVMVFYYFKQIYNARPFLTGLSDYSEPEMYVYYLFISFF